MELKKSHRIEKFISLTSDQRDVNVFPSTGNFSVRFNQEIKLDKEYDWSIALDKAALWYSYPNVSASSYDNADFTYWNGAIWQTFTIAEGIYNFSDLNSVIQAGITGLGDVGANINYVPNFNTQRITVQLAGGYQWDPTTSNLYKLFGFSDAQAAAPIVVTTLATEVANVTNDVTSLYIKLDILRDTWENASGGQVLYAFLPDGPPGSIISLDPPERIYISILPTEAIQSLRIFVQDNLSRNVDFRGESTAYTLHIRGRLRGT